MQTIEGLKSLSLKQQAKGRGRNAVLIDWQLVDEMLEAECSSRSIADRIGCDVSTLYRRCEMDREILFTQLAQLKAQTGRDNLRLTQHRKAVIDKDNTMLIWLGKNRLGQSDKSEVVQTTINIDASEVMAQKLIAQGFGEDQARQIACTHFGVLEGEVIEGEDDEGA